MDYKSTLNLPKTPFPMRGNLPVKEKETLRHWEEIDLYGKMIRQRAGGPQFVLHDGPPYANGNIHLGTALNKILKDIIVRSKFMSGFRADYVPGWDCHGLPIEHQAEKEMKERQAAMTKMEVRAYCRKYASRFLDIQREEFKRLGGVGDWDHPYITMDYAYQATIIEEMAKFFERGEVYRKKKPVYWCINCRTALAEAEIEYEMDTSTSIYVKFPLISREESCKRLPGQADIHAYMDDDALDAAREPRHRRQSGIYLCRRRDAAGDIHRLKRPRARHHGRRPASPDWRIIGEISPQALEGAFVQASFYRQEIGRGLRRLCGRATWAQARSTSRRGTGKRTMRPASNTDSTSIRP